MLIDVRVEEGREPSRGVEEDGAYALRASALCLSHPSAIERAPPSSRRRQRSGLGPIAVARVRCTCVHVAAPGFLTLPGLCASSASRAGKNRVAARVSRRPHRPLRSSEGYWAAARGRMDVGRECRPLVNDRWSRPLRVYAGRMHTHHPQSGLDSPCRAGDCWVECRKYAKHSDAASSGHCDRRAAKGQRRDRHHARRRDLVAGRTPRRKTLD
jgi:hypothetical protein